MEFQSRLLAAVQAQQQVPADTGQEVVVAEYGIGDQGVDEVEAGLRPVRHPERDRPVELDHRRRQQLRQPPVQGRDLRPVR
ncbi:hypothetical protein OTB20_08970 [Streptomyces sp. H27-H1]|uniref:hypothetical protein n=1 Tax=Streptomyces sp. H27-H1 TaxID=2996461 RepID=UPI00226E0672|nr:hypothetical protein [Streptomyces sp. H27-H1]MCY0926334.1 hypothetical protein [Streptomyces sp. H27-H1]